MDGLDEKPRLRSHHRDARWRGRREVHRFVDLLKKDVLDENSYSYARSFVGRDGQIRSSVGVRLISTPVWTL